MKRVLAMLMALGMMSVQAALTVVETKGGWAVLKDGKPLVDRIFFGGTKGRVPSKPHRTFQQLPDGTKVWNEWNEGEEMKYRFELAQFKDGHIEATMSGEDPAFTQNSRIIHVAVPFKRVEGKPYQALLTNGRKWEPEEGVMDGSFKNHTCRWFVIDGVIFDFNPIGPTDYCMMYSTGTVKGVWGVKLHEAGFPGMLYMYGGGSSRPSLGGFNGAKLVIREGRNEDYPKYHFLKQYTYSQHLLSSQLLKFGAPKAGKAFSDGNFAYSAAKGMGWAAGSPKPVVGYKEGAYYSHVRGKGVAKYRLTGYHEGYYVVTVGAGNYPGTPNNFTVKVNGEEYGKGLQIPAKESWMASKVVRVAKGEIEVSLEGDYLLSVIGVQPLMSEAEDFTMRRGYWVTDGYEPGSIYRNEDYKRPPVLKVSVQRIPLPVPGTELAAKPTEPPKPTLQPNPEMPSLDWLKSMSMCGLQGNSDVLNELADPALRERYFKQEVDGKGYNCVMVSGLHSRHTYFNHVKRSTEYFRKLCGDLHKRGIKVIDHHDATLLWNSDAGLRTLAERLGEISVAVLDFQPSFQFCFNSPAFKETYYGYLLEQVKAGVDGFQLDELGYWPQGCGCQACREQFHRETGCWLPMNECDPCFNNLASPLWRRWLDWRTVMVTNWFVELRRRAMPIKPDLVLSIYTTHWGFTRSGPRYAASGNLVDMARTFNVFGTEVMTRNSLMSSRPLLPYRKMKNILSKAYGAQVWGLYYSSDWKVDYFAWAVANLVGQASWLSKVDRTGAPDYRAFAGSKENMVRRGAEPLAEIALLFSAPSRDWNSGIGFEGELFGLAQTLEEMHVPYEMIGEMSLKPEVLAKYKVLSIGTSGCLSDAEVAAIKDFARAGGTVHLSCNAGGYNELGILRRKWAFADVFGFDLLLTSSKPQVREVGGVKLKAPMVSFARLNQLEKPWRTVRQYGKGRFIYSGIPLAAQFYAREGTPGAEWKYDPNPALYAFFQQEIRDLFGQAFLWKVDVPAKVFTALWKQQDGTLVAHFLNGTGCDIKAGQKMIQGAPKDAFPAMPKDIVFTLPCEKATSAYATSPDFSGRQPVRFQKNADGTATVTLPKALLRAYTLVKIQ